MNKQTTKQEQEQKQDKKPTQEGKRAKQQKARADLRKEIKAVMRKHIGEENAILGEDLFRAVFKFAPETANFYEVAYLWGVLKKRVYELRKTSEVIIVQRQNKFFVLKTEEELEKYNKQLDRAIRGLEGLQVRATEWVNREKWRYL